VRRLKEELPKRLLHRHTELVGGKRRRGTRMRLLDRVEQDAAATTGVGRDLEEVVVDRK
jgi:hypothetical protein